MNRNFITALLIFIFVICAFVSRLGAEEELAFPNPEATISMDFQDASLKNILKVFSMQSGLNFIASDTLQDRKMTLYLDKVSIKEAMDKIFEANNLSYSLDKKSNILIVKDLGRPAIETITRIFFLKYATVSSSALEKEKSANMSSSSASSSSSGSSSSASSGSSGDSTGSGIAKTVQKLLSANGSCLEDPRTNSLIVTETPIRMETIAKTIAALDVSVPQVMLEVEMLDVSKNTIDKLGIKYDQDLTGSMFTAILKGAKISTGFPIPDSFYNPLQFPKTFTPGTFDASTQYNVTLEFIKQQADSKTLARPRILTLNNQTAEIKIATREAIGTLQQASSGCSLTQTTSSAERVDTGVSLRVTPQINTETGEITMFLLPKVADATTSSSFAGSSSFKDPEERSTKSIVRVKDGETIIMGGLIRNEKSETVTKLPFFGDLPLVGGFFRHKYKDKDKERELVIFITPHIIKEGNSPLNSSNQPKKLPVPEREQSIISGASRQMAISNYLNTFDKNRR